MTPEEGHWAEAQRRLKVAEELHAEICRTFPEVGDTPTIRMKSAAWRALLTAIEIIRMNPPRENFGCDLSRGHWAGLIEGAMRIIGDVEIAMYDPRSHPERYEQ